MKYGILKSVAHNWGDSFVGTLNWWKHDYVMSHLVRTAIETGTDKLEANLLTGEAGPDTLLREPFREALAYKTKWFPELAASQGVSMEVIAEAWLRIKFDLSLVHPLSGGSNGGIKVPYELTVTIKDDRGTLHKGHITDYWYV